MMGILSDSFKATLDAIKEREEQHQREIQALIDDTRRLIDELESLELEDHNG